jgi:hypothetical protein
MTSREAAPAMHAISRSGRPTASLFVFSVTCTFVEQILAKNRNDGYTAVVMNDLSHIRRPSPSTSERPIGGAPSQLNALNGESGPRDFFGPGGRSKSLKRLNPAMEIQGKPRLFLGFFLSWLVPAWLKLDSAWAGLGLARCPTVWRAGSSLPRGEEPSPGLDRPLAGDGA